jgi:hypothetical protein
MRNSAKNSLAPQLPLPVMTDRLQTIRPKLRQWVY